MKNQTTFHHDKLEFSGNHKLNFGMILFSLMISIYLVLNNFNKDITTNRIIIMVLASISFILLFVALMTRDYSSETDIKNIQKIRLNIDVMGNIILTIRNQKRKIRKINLEKNFQEASAFIDFAKKHDLRLDCDEEKFK